MHTKLKIFAFKKIVFTDNKQKDLSAYSIEPNLLEGNYIGFLKLFYRKNVIQKKKLKKFLLSLIQTII